MTEPDYRPSPVPLYMVTAGDARPSRNTIRPETLLLADPDRLLPITANREQHALIQMCQGMLSLAEAAAHLGLPVSVVAVVASALVDTGHLCIRSATPHDELPDRDLLKRVLHGLRNL